MIEEMPRPTWEPLPRQGTTGVSARVLLRRDGLAIASLRFEAHATIAEHSAPFEIDVICVAGEGFVSVGGQAAALRSGQRVVWPAGLRHRLWTAGATMETLMVEHRS